MNVSSRVPYQFAGGTLLGYLAQRFSYLSESAWQELLQEGRIVCNGVCSDGTARIKAGDMIGCDLPDFDAPAVNFDYAVVYQDEWLLAINKPAGLRVHSGGRFVTANLIYHLRHSHLPPYPEANPANRLDADTSGLILLARDKRVLSELMRQFSEGDVEKRYLAVVAGCPSPGTGTINLPIGPVKDAAVPRYWIDQRAGKPAVTRYRALRKLSERYSLLELSPETGRTHQLRVHLAAVGHPIAGDALYTMNDDEYLAFRRTPPPASGLTRQALHSQTLSFVHPVLQSPLTLIAPLAADMEQFIRNTTA